MNMLSEAIFKQGLLRRKNAPRNDGVFFNAPKCGTSAARRPRFSGVAVWIIGSFEVEISDYKVPK